MVVIVWSVAGKQFPAGSVDQATRSRCYVVKVVKRSSDDRKATKDDE